MYKEHQIFEPPEKNAKIWRYMDFAKLVWMLNHRCLYFTNVDKLKIEDPFEGSCAELDTQIIIANKRNYVTKSEAETLAEDINYESRMFVSLINRI